MNKKIICDFCLEEVEVDELVDYNGEKMCYYCYEAFFEKDEMDRYYKEEYEKYCENPY